MIYEQANVENVNQILNVETHMLKKLSSGQNIFQTVSDKMNPILGKIFFHNKNIEIKVI